MTTPTQHALRVVVWQTLTAFAMMAIAILVETIAGIELPRSVSCLGVVLGAQTYAVSHEMKDPGILGPLLRTIALRAAAVSALVQIALASLMLALAARTPDPETQQLTTFLIGTWWAIPMCALLAFGLTYVLTRFALQLGVRTAKRALARRSAAPRR